MAVPRCTAGTASAACRRSRPRCCARRRGCPRTALPRRSKPERAQPQAGGWPGRTRSRAALRRRPATSCASSCSSKPGPHEGHHRRHAKAGHHHVVGQVADDLDEARVETDLLVRLAQRRRRGLPSPASMRPPGKADLAGVVAQLRGALRQQHASSASGRSTSGTSTAAGSRRRRASSCGACWLSAADRPGTQPVLDRMARLRCRPGAHARCSASPAARPRRAGGCGPASPPTLNLRRWCRP